MKAAVQMGGKMFFVRTVTSQDHRLSRPGRFQAGALCAAMNCFGGCLQEIRRKMLYELYGSDRIYEKPGGSHHAGDGSGECADPDREF